MVRKVVINNEEYELDAPDDMPLLWVLRDILELTGTKFGCGKAQCGACTVLINDSPARSCVTPLSAVAHQEITTIEGLANLPESSLQNAWVEHNVPQCGYCQSGQILTVVALLSRNTKPDEQTVNRTMNVLCRCGTYPRIRKAITKAGEIMEKQDA